MGIIIFFQQSPFSKLCKEKFFIENDKETVRSRRIERSDQPDPPGYFDQYVWPFYWKNREEIVNQQISKLKP